MVIAIALFIYVFMYLFSNTDCICIIYIEQVFQYVRLYFKSLARDKHCKLAEAGRASLVAILYVSSPSN